VIESMQRSLLRVVVMGTAFINGFVIMGIELLGARIMAPYFGSSVHVWGSIITVFMLSLSLGYLIGGRLSSRAPGPHVYSLFFFAAAILSVPIIVLADWTMGGIFLAIEDPRYGSLLTAMLLYFLPIAVMGMVSPYSIRLLVQSEQHSGRTAGALYFISTLGSALGTLVTSFYFVLWFDIHHIMWTMVLLLILCGTSVLAAWRWSVRPS
jgi:MFS family permease